MYKLLNKLFGWDYVHWANFADQGIARLHVSPDGKVWFWRYKSTKVIDILPVRFATVIFLTCRSEKYLPEDSKI